MSQRTDQFIEDVGLLLDGCADAEVRTRIESAMDEDESLVDLYRELVAVDAELNWRQRREPLRIPADPSKPRAAAQRGPGVSTSLSPRERVGVRAKYQLAPAVVALAAAFILTAAVVALYVFAIAPGSHTEHPQPSGPAVGVLLDADGVTWNSDYRNAGAELSRDTYEIAGGSIEAELFSGANIRLTGPARMRLVRDDRVFLQRGRLNVHKDGGGFTVDLPGGRRVVDLGTAFTIDVDDDGTAHVRVTEGIVRVERDATDAEPALAFNVEADWRTELSADPSDRTIEVVRDLEVVNPSFEADGRNRAGGALPQGWKSSIPGRGGCEDHVGNGNFTTGVDGRFVGLVNYPIASDPKGVASSIYQDTGHATQAGTTYRLIVSVGRRINVGELAGPGAWRIALVDAATDESLASADGVVSEYGVMRDQAVELPVAASDAGRRLRIALINPPEGVAAGRDPHQINFDNVRLVAHREIRESAQPETGAN